MSTLEDLKADMGSVIELLHEAHNACDFAKQADTLVNFRMHALNAGDVVTDVGNALLQVISRAKELTEH